MRLDYGLSGEERTQASPESRPESRNEVNGAGLGLVRRLRFFWHTFQAHWTFVRPVYPPLAHCAIIHSLLPSPPPYRSTALLRVSMHLPGCRGSNGANQDMKSGANGAEKTSFWVNRGHVITYTHSKQQLFTCTAPIYYRHPNTCSRSRYLK